MESPPPPPPLPEQPPALPSPLPPPLPTSMPMPTRLAGSGFAAAPAALEYGTPAPRGSVPGSFHWGLFGFSAAWVWCWLALMLFAVPKFEAIFMDFKIRTGPVAHVVFGLARALTFAWIVVLPVPVLLGFAGAELSPHGRRMLRRLVVVVFGVLAVLLVLGVAMPLFTLTQAMSSLKK